MTTLYSGAEVEEGPVDSTGVLVQAVNHATGTNTWRMMPPDYDYQQEVARASFADMLHDSERNKLYYAGLKAAIQQRRAAGLEVHVLDIGTGTGLLAMMAAREGADSVVACEEFRPMAECAAKVIRDNGLDDKIKLVRKRSTELTVGPGGDLEQKANILVTEVFDTELIGEGAIGTYNHAASHLLTEDRLVVPGVARLWAQVVSSPKCADWAGPKALPLGAGSEAPLLLPPSAQGAGGSTLALHDLQLSELDPSLFTPLTPPLLVFQMDLACYSTPLPLTDQTVTTTPALATGSCDAVFMWWDCYTDPGQTILLSCAPSWASHHPPAPLPWRDHWMQAIYYPSTSLRVEKGQQLDLISCHDEYSLWFDVRPSTSTALKPLALPSPSPGLQTAMSRLRIGQVNNDDRVLALSSVISRLVSRHPKSTFLCLGDQSLLGLMAAKLGAVKVLVCETNRHMRDYMIECAASNMLEDKVTLLDSDSLASTDLSEVDVVISEPYYSVSVLPWHNLLFWFTLSSLDLSPGVEISPRKARLYILPVHLRDLWKIRAPLGDVEGFKMTHFDTIMEQASVSCDQTVEPHPLWEYPCVALAQPHNVLEFDLASQVPGSQGNIFNGEVELGKELMQEVKLNGVALWMDWNMDQTTVLSGGPCREVVVGQEVKWDMDSKQGVHLLKEPTSSSCRLSYSIEFLPSEGDFKFEFRTD